MPQPSSSGGFRVDLTALEGGKEALATLREQFADADNALNGTAEAVTLDEGKIAGFGKDRDMWPDFPSGIRDGKRELAKNMMDCLQQIKDGRKALHESFVAFEARFAEALNAYRDADSDMAGKLSSILRDTPGVEERRGNE